MEKGIDLLRAHLSKKEFKEVLSNTNRQYGHYVTLEKLRSSPKSALLAAFTWKDSKQGSGYWVKVYHTLPSYDTI